MPKVLRFLIVIGLSVAIGIAISQYVASDFGLPKPTPTYRRIGPTTGAQVFLAGSSLTQFGISWPDVSIDLNQGIENWGLGGSSPEEWEISQKIASNYNLMIIGVSVYDLNEYHLCNYRANVVPLFHTVKDLWDNGSNWQFSKRLLSQYPLVYLRTLFPTAGNSDPVLVGLRRLLPVRFREAAAADDRANAMVLPGQAVLEFGGSSEKLSEWPTAKTVRRLALLRSEIRDLHSFDGPKHRAFIRMIDTALQRGKVVVVVMPVSQVYADAFLTSTVKQQFDDVLSDLVHRSPQVRIIRLDHVPGIADNQNFTDMVHLNGEGRVVATAAFMRDLNKQGANR